MSTPPRVTIQRERDGALDRKPRGRVRIVATFVVAATVSAAISLSSAVAPAAAQGSGSRGSAALTPAAMVDIGSFSARAEAWTSARSAFREEARDHVIELAGEVEAEQAEAEEAEAERLAAEESEAERAAELAAEEERAAVAAAAVTTTTAPPATTTAPPAPTTAAPAPAAPAPTPGGPSAAQWAALRNCESGGNYGAVSSSGAYRGAYQFSQGTWDLVARSAAPGLVGTDPAAASPAQQDAMAAALYARSGASPWPHCGAHLR